MGLAGGCLGEGLGETCLKDALESSLIEDLGDLEDWWKLGDRLKEGLAAIRLGERLGERLKEALLGDLLGEDKGELCPDSYPDRL